MRREALVSEARSWLGTPWVHQGRRKGEGVDCVGFVVEAAKAAGVLEVDEAASYKRRPDGVTLRGKLAAHLEAIRTTEIRPGDVVLLRTTGVIDDHVALVVDHPQRGLGLIHAYLPMKKVVEHGLDAQWRGRIIAAYRIPGIE